MRYWDLVVLGLHVWLRSCVLWLACWTFGEGMEGRWMASERGLIVYVLAG